MKKFMRLLNATLLSAFLAVGMSSCFFGGGSGQPTSSSPGGYSSFTNLEYNDDENEGFLVNDFRGQPEGPNLRFIEGGRTVLGSFEEDLLNSNNNVERAVTVASFYMDETETANIHWLEYLHYIRKDSSREFFESALPDTTVWAKDLAYNDPYVDHYLRYPGFRFFPVVGVTWLQAQDFCNWRTLVVNQKLAEESGYFDDQGAEAVDSDGRIPLESGVVLPNYRLPTEAEWEYAARGGLDFSTYPWGGRYTTSDRGCFLANFKPSRGDYAVDGALYTVEAKSYNANDYGLYNMAGNVSEWTNTAYNEASYYLGSTMNPNVEDRDNHRKVIRGGSWKDVAYFLEVSTRDYEYADTARSYIGFRTAQDYLGTLSE